LRRRHHALPEHGQKATRFPEGKEGLLIVLIIKFTWPLGSIASTISPT
jgi:hypothetical protein